MWEINALLMILISSNGVFGTTQSTQQSPQKETTTESNLQVTVENSTVENTQRLLKILSLEVVESKPENVSAKAIDDKSVNLDTKRDTSHVANDTGNASDDFRINGSAIPSGRLLIKRNNGSEAQIMDSTEIAVETSTDPAGRSAMDLSIETSEFHHSSTTSKPLDTYEKTQSVEITTFANPGSSSTVDPIDEEIKQVLHYLPKLPETPFADNKSHFVYHKDPEEADLDERITQVARQLAETSLKREFEEKKLGHYIPIRLRHFDEDATSSMAPGLRQYNPTKSYKNPYELYQGVSEQPRVSFKPMSLPQHIYGKRFYLPVNLSPQASSTEMDETSKLHSTESEDTSTTNSQYSLATDFPTVFRLAPRYVFPTSRNLVARSRIPLLINVTPKEPIPQPFFDDNDLGMYPYEK